VRREGISLVSLRLPAFFRYGFAISNTCNAEAISSFIWELSAREEQGIGAGLPPVASDSLRTELPPVVPGVHQAFIHHRIETGVLLDEDLAELAVLAQEDGLQADQFQQGQEHGDERAL